MKNTERIDGNELAAQFIRDAQWHDLPDDVQHLWGANYYSADKFERFPSLVISFDLVTMIR
jgi:hypothetical protein